MTSVYRVPVVHSHSNPMDTFQQSLDSLVTLSSTIDRIFSTLHLRVDSERARLDALSNRIAIAEVDLTSRKLTHFYRPPSLKPSIIQQNQPLLFLRQAIQSRNLRLSNLFGQMTPLLSIQEVPYSNQNLFPSKNPNNPSLDLIYLKPEISQRFQNF